MPKIPLYTLALCFLAALTTAVVSPPALAVRPFDQRMEDLAAHGELHSVPNVEVMPAASTTAASPQVVLRVGPLQAFKTIASASTQARSGDIIEIDAGDYVADVAVWTQDRLTIRGFGGEVRLIAAGASAKGKAIWVINGTDVTVENISFRDAKARDHNGAGIRFEQGTLLVNHCSFFNNENGILTSNNANAELVIENSVFGDNGAGDGRSHNLYVGQIKKLTVTGSYFHHAKKGHLLKSRAAENHIFYNRLSDEIGGTASYELEFPNGGLAYVVGNIIQQASTTENPVVISYGAEGYKWPRNELYLTFNTIVDDLPKGGVFLKHQPGLDRLLAVNNILVGEGSLEGGSNRWSLDLVERLLAAKQPSSDKRDIAIAVQTDHNVTTGWESFVQASRYDYRLRSGALADFQVVKLAPVHGVDLEPHREYSHPAGSRRLTSALLRPGAVQSKTGDLP